MSVKFANLFTSHLLRLKKKLFNRKLSSWSQEEFIESLQEINRLSSQFVSQSSSQLIFSLAPGTYSSWIDENGVEHWHESWRRTLRICVYKVDKHSNIITSEKVIDVDSYCKLLNTMDALSAHCDAEESIGDISNETSTSNSLPGPSSRTTTWSSQQPADPFILIPPNSSTDFKQEVRTSLEAAASDDLLLRREISASLWFDNIHAEQSFEDEGETGQSYGSKGQQCFICMDRKADVILSCMHMYCSDCIESWDKTDNDNHDRCPQCRHKMSLKDNWVLFSSSDTPSQTDVSDYLMESCKP